MGDAEQGSHAELLHTLAVEHFDVQFEVAGHLLRLLRDDGGRHQVGGLVAEIAREVLRFGQDHAALQSRFKFRQVRGRHQRKRFQRLGVARRLVHGRFVVAQDRAFHGGFGGNGVVVTG